MRVGPASEDRGDFDRLLPRLRSRGGNSPNPNDPLEDSVGRREPLEVGDLDISSGGSPPNDGRLPNSA